jgi:hypothetical protein
MILTQRVLTQRALTQRVLTPGIQDWLTALGEGTYCHLRCFQVAFFAHAPHTQSEAVRFAA